MLTLSLTCNLMDERRARSATEPLPVERPRQSKKAYSYQFYQFISPSGLDRGDEAQTSGLA